MQSWKKDYGEEFADFTNGNFALQLQKSSKISCKATFHRSEHSTDSMSGKKDAQETQRKN